MNFTKNAVLFLFSLVAASVQAQSPAISFKLYHAVPMTPTSTAGAVPAANWNNVKDMTSGVTVKLNGGKILDNSGAVVPNMTAAFTGGSTVGGANTVDFQPSASNDSLLFNGAYEQAAGGVSSIYVNNIPYSNYDVYLYVADSGAGSAGSFAYTNFIYALRGGLNLTAYTPSTYVQSSTVDLGTGASISQGNYVHFSNLSGPLNLTMNAVGAGSATPTLAFSGMQIVSTTPPTVGIGSAPPAWVEQATPIYQYAVPVVPIASDYTVPVTPDPTRFAYLWLPPGITHVRGLIVGVYNLLEAEMFSDPQIRQTLTNAGLGIVFINSESNASMDLGADANSGPNPVSGNRINQAGNELVRVLNMLAVQSGYPEIAYAPLMLTGHSAASPFAWTNGLYNTPALTGRVFGLLPYKGTFPGTCPVNIPTLSVTSEWGEVNVPPGENWSLVQPLVQNLRNQGNTCLLGVYEDVGAGHFDWNRNGVGPIAQFIASAAAAMIPATVAPLASGTPVGPVALNSMTNSSGYVIPYSALGTASGTPIPASTYSGTGGAYWYVDLATANAINTRMVTETAKQPQMVDVPLGGVTQLSSSNAFEVGWGTYFSANGLAAVEGEFIAQSPFPTLYPGLTLGHSTNGPILYKPNGAGLRQVGPNSFRVWIDRGNPTLEAWPFGGTLLAYHPGDTQYRSADRPVTLNLQFPNNPGSPQTITVAPVPDQSAGHLQPVQLTGSATSGLPVQFWVVAGPYTISDTGVLLPQPIPAHTSYPMKVTVGAYQTGGASGSTSYMAAGPVYTSFNINPILVNGSFEAGPTVANNSWQFTNALSGWTNTQGQIAVFNNFSGWHAADGSHWIQLDSSYGVDSISQTVSTTAGNMLWLTFSYSPYAGRTAATNQFNVVWNGQVIDTLAPNGTNFAAPVWYSASYMVKATGNDTLAFTESGVTNDVVGALLDQVSLVDEGASTNVYQTPAINLSYLKPAKGNNLGWGTTAGLAVDGNVDGNYINGSLVVSNAGVQDWWQVDLGAQDTLQSVNIFGRSDCCISRMSNYYVFSSVTDMTGQTLAQLLANPAVTSVFVANPLTPEETVSLGGAVGRYVRVQMSGTSELQLAEVQVMGWNASSH